MIELKGYDAAAFIADMKYTDDKLLKRGRRRHGFSLTDRPRVDPEESRIKRWKMENQKSEYILKYLREHCSNTDYARKYEENNKWSKQLMFPTEESKKCERLAEDVRHCTMKREKISCYTCCFVCYTPAMCVGTNCPLLPENRRPH
ncbi:hypothetical protein J2Z22_002205 [Paenibacillus forsythiae]|uniref:Transposase DDE domain-containing protein n=1 Tax=Paenibacillus forsythiae TaxID=365616 RepID=A0ABU3H773_9BACL|nr:hypothetical protein [Paenibacillus forsythiae]MDT3426671.1 hypothetical protein [Paenibacillus forsythiae]